MRRTKSGREWSVARALPRWLIFSLQDLLSSRRNSKNRNCRSQPPIVYFACSLYASPVRMAQSLFNSSAVLSISVVDWRTFPPRPTLVLSAKSPHKCQRCSYCFKFETKKNFSRYLTIRDDFAPYDSSTLKISLKDAVQAAQNGCQFHQWTLHLISRNIHDPNAKFPSHAEVEITLKLQKIYKTEFIPHDFVQQDGRRLKWDPSKRLQETLTEPFIQYRYQAASSPYRVNVEASIKLVNGVVASGCDSFSFCRTRGYSGLCYPASMPRGV